jgi:predicted CXXCH cytochrome family protein
MAKQSGGKQQRPVVTRREQSPQQSRRLYSSFTSRSLFVLSAAVVLVAIVGLAVRLARRTPRHVERISRPLAPTPTFVGSSTCGGCHNDELVAWTGSHHQLAMQPATDASVLGDFRNVMFSDGGVRATFFRRGGKFMVRTDGPDAAVHDYEMKFAFGVSPLQQYLIAMPGGRLQAFGVAWDSRPRGSGGQRWFFLYPGQSISTSSPLHWTNIDQNWNYMCADCHSTNVRKNYDLHSRNYATSYDEIDVACEACHGPGSGHVRWAKKEGDWRRVEANEGLTIALDERKGVAWSTDPASGKPFRNKPRTTEPELQMCARCHARRGQIHEDYVHGQPIGDDYRLALLENGLYFPDGQIKGEVYEYGSLIQSRMFSEGVTCSDCHDPHTLKLRAEGNDVCLQCHLAQKYDSPKHYFHQRGSAGAQCVQCHMPTHLYMVIDQRRDHSIRIPRPDLSVKLGTPNACNGCHADKPAQWASDAISKWYGHPPGGFQQFAEVLHAGAEGPPGAQQSLTALAMNRSQPAIARATALSLLAAYGPAPDDVAVGSSITDDSALVRRAATRSLSNSDPNASSVILTPLISDPVREVRIETAEVLAHPKSDATTSDVIAALDRSTNEYIAAQELNGDRPEAHLNLGLLFLRERKIDRAEAELKTALSLDPSFGPAAVNLGDLYREVGRDAEGEAVLRGVLKRSPDDASVLHALGLLMVRQKQDQNALALFAAAARIDPSNARYAYVYAIALHDSGQGEQAIHILEHNVSVHAYDRDSLAALVVFCDQTAKDGEAVNYAQRLSELEPGNLQLQQTITSLKRRLGETGESTPAAASK